LSIIVCPLAYVERVARERRPSHILTLLNPGHETDWPLVDAYAEALTADGLMAREHLRLEVYDITEETEGMVLPDESIVRRVIDFGRTWDAHETILVHCYAGISRSTASAFILACEKNPHAPEREIARELRRRSPTAFPNLRIVSLADDVLGRRGRMVDAINAMGPADWEQSAEPFELKALW
jgi:predicted protein tyrosine phosphatase